MELLTASGAGQPLWLWVAFVSFIGLLLWIDLGLVNRGARVVSAGKSATMWASFASLALAFAVYVGSIYEPDPRYYLNPYDLNGQAAVQYLTGYILETALAFDNIFVISLIFAYLRIPREHQHRVLFWGIIGAIAFRGIFVSAGAAMIHSWTWILYVFGALIIWTGWKTGTKPERELQLEKNALLKLLKRRLRVTDTIEGQRFFIHKIDAATGQRVLFATPLFLALVMVETSDVIFAIDSVPAIFAVTRDPFIVYTSNIFAILGLRSMYFMLSAAVTRFRYLKYGLSLVLILIGAKIIWNFGLARELGLVPYIAPHWSLLATLALIGTAIIFSIFRTRGGPAGGADQTS